MGSGAQIVIPTLHVSGTTVPKTILYCLCILFTPSESGNEVLALLSHSRNAVKQKFKTMFFKIPQTCERLQNTSPGGHEERDLI